ncbi:MAG: hypothetical protein AAFZ09_02745 [Pseudomonadota bacterium]
MRACLTLALATLAAATLPATAPRAEEMSAGEKLATFACGRCHVVSERNRMGGIGSTPSFAAMRTIEDWERRFRTFYALRPHGAFTQVEGVTPPFDPLRPPAIHPVEVTEADIEAIVDFARSIPPKDLGAPLPFD